MAERATVVHNPPENPPRRYAVIPDITISGTRDPAQDHPGGSDGRAVSVVLPDTYPAYERFIQINAENRSEAVAIIEVLSSTNQRQGRERNNYLQKRHQILSSSTTHLIEIDLLRDGTPISVVGYDDDASYRLWCAETNCAPQPICTHSLCNPASLQSLLLC